MSLRGLIGAFFYKPGVRADYVSGSFGSCVYALWDKASTPDPGKIFRTQVLVHRGFELYAFRTKALTVIKDRRVNFDIINFRATKGNLRENASLKTDLCPCDKALT